MCKTTEEINKEFELNKVTSAGAGVVRILDSLEEEPEYNHEKTIEDRLLNNKGE